MLKEPSLKLESPEFLSGTPIPSQYTCDGRNVNPPLEISNVAPGMVSFALIMDDPDAPGGIWTHWVKWNIPPETRVIKEGEEPKGVSGKGSSESSKYDGPCPPRGHPHRYVFKLYALDIILALPEGGSRNELEEALAGHVLQETELVGLYGR